MVPSIQETKRNESIRNERKEKKQFIIEIQDDRMKDYEDQKWKENNATKNVPYRYQYEPHDSCNTPTTTQKQVVNAWYIGCKKYGWYHNSNNIIWNVKI